MASAKTIIKKVSRRRGTVSLTKVRQVVDSVYDKYVADSSAQIKARPRSIGKAAKRSAAAVVSR